MPITADTHVRLARPSRDLAAAERFWTQGPGLDVLYRSEGGHADEHDLVMLGLPGAGWHLELVGGATLAVEPRPTGEDLLVLYLDGPADDELVPRLERAGGTRVSAGPYWDRWGVTFADPDGYRLVLCTRAWSND
ncbi:VOC family protein [Micromonospora aurantiaca (nom. illeg.)]|uniref:VOC family protein n=1 Tax=Micromonospora aurantiaca (nom. illeg.) TaxID=47850 RepID=UPI0036A1575C